MIGAMNLTQAQCRNFFLVIPPCSHRLLRFLRRRRRLRGGGDGVDNVGPAGPLAEDLSPDTESPRPSGQPLP